MGAAVRHLVAISEVQNLRRGDLSTSCQARLRVAGDQSIELRMTLSSERVPHDRNVPGIPLHTNASENVLRACVIKRRISGGTMSMDGREARDVVLGLMKTCQKPGISFFTYPGDRLVVQVLAARTV